MLKYALAASAVIVVVFAFLAGLTDDPEIFRRGGALLAAMAALLALLEASIEHEVRGIDAERERSEEEVESGPDRTIGRMAARIRAARFRGSYLDLSRRKLRTVFWISLIAVSGEFIHGFGDMMFEAGREVSSVLSDLMLSLWVKLGF